MMMFGTYRTAEYYRKLERVREEIRKELEAKGMVRGHGKFDKVVEQKLRRRKIPD